MAREQVKEQNTLKLKRMQREPGQRADEYVSLYFVASLGGKRLLVEKFG